MPCACVCVCLTWRTEGLCLSLLRASCLRWRSASAASTLLCSRSREWEYSGVTFSPAPCRRTATASPPPSHSCSSTLCSTPSWPGTLKQCFQVSGIWLIYNSCLQDIGWLCEVSNGVKNVNLTGQFGIPRPWYFPFTKSYWCGEKCGWITAAPTNNKENAEGIKNLGCVHYFWQYWTWFRRICLTKSYWMCAL